MSSGTFIHENLDALAVTTFALLHLARLSWLWVL